MNTTLDTMLAAYLAEKGLKVTALVEPSAPALVRNAAGRVIDPTTKRYVAEGTAPKAPKAPKAKPVRKAKAVKVTVSRKAARRELAAQMRKAGVQPTGAAWVQAKKAAGIA